jgi:hypothetical protein
MGARSSGDESAIALAAAVEKWVAEGAASTSLPQAIEESIDALLYQYGSDGILELSVVTGPLYLVHFLCGSVPAKRPAGCSLGRWTTAD